MSKYPLSKLQSSLSLEDLLNQPDTHNSQNWLLSYLDVFVLIVMLVITLITLSDLNTEQQQAAANKPRAIKPRTVPTVICPPVVVPAIVTCPPPIVAENKPVQAIVPIENNVEIKTEAKENNSIAPAPVNTPEIKSADNITTKPIPQPINTQQATVKPTDENKLQQQLTKAIDEFGLNKTVNIKVTHGYAQLEIQDKVLFKSSEADLTVPGKALIKRLTPLLKQAVGLILIEGHTDNIPIKTAQFPSNWELGSSRATSVLHFLVSQQLDSSRLRAITYADTMPVTDNATPEGREKNRRVNILIKFSEQ
ncbi:OmpA/MotB family protein [Methylobacter svalbardensis]|uniref:OmpA/MotB family protein n=1 Tax=Methylobacter svalbardensis TaxID=3080016 RepID=UPI0030ED976A